MVFKWHKTDFRANWHTAVFPLNANKLRICEIMSGGFAVKIQQSIKKFGGFGNFLTLLKFLQFC